MAPASSAAPLTLAFSVARLTLASSTPGTFFNAFSTRATQDAQVMPLTANVNCGSSAVAVSIVVSMLAPVSQRQDNPSHDGKVKRLRAASAAPRQAQMASGPPAAAAAAALAASRRPC